jgi:hypothetical protein
MVFYVYAFLNKRESKYRIGYTSNLLSVIKKFTDNWNLVFLKKFYLDRKANNFAKYCRNLEFSEKLKEFGNKPINLKKLEDKLNDIV